MKNKISNGVINILSVLVYAGVGIITLYLCTLMMRNKVFILNDEHSLFSKQSFHVFLFEIIIITFLLIVYFWIEKRLDNRKQIYISRFLFIMGAALTVFIVLCLQVNPTYDQFNVYYAAQQMHLGDYTLFQEGEYLYKYPFQKYLVIYFYWLIQLFGQNNIIAVQAVNVLWVLVAWLSLYYISRHIFSNTILGTTVSIIVFVPCSFYATFVYGNIVGFALVLAALCLLEIYIKKQKLLCAFASVLFLTVAMLLKQLFAIYAVGFIVYILIIIYIIIIY